VAPLDAIGRTVEPAARGLQVRERMGGAGKSFGDYLTESLAQVDDLQKSAVAAIEQMATGEGPGFQRR
jgi:flagellar hook-basal body complex protein FliE